MILLVCLLSRLSVRLINRLRLQESFDRSAIHDMFPIWEHADGLLCMLGSARPIAARPSRTSFSRSRRPLRGLGGPWWLSLYSDEGVSGAYGRARRPRLDALLKGVSRKEFDLVAAWSVCRLGRSLPDLISMLSELRSRDIDLYLHLQALDTSTPSGRALFGMLSVFSEFERAMIRDRVMAGLERARAEGKRLGRPRTTPFQLSRLRAALDEGRGVRETARMLKVSPAKVSPVRRMGLATVDLR
jgi:DNA invertase Pin-like site-specific DNA recombinase